MSRKFFLTAILAGVLALALAPAASAQRGGMMMDGPGYGSQGYGQGMSGRMSGSGSYNYDDRLNEQQRKDLDACRLNFEKDVQPLRNELYAKLSELEGVVYSKSPDKARVNSLISRISDLRKQILERSVSYKMEAYQKTGVICGGDRGFGMGLDSEHMMNQGGGRGRGMGSGGMMGSDGGNMGYRYYHD